jgi:hypothetical protein
MRRSSGLNFSLLAVALRKILYFEHVFLDCDNSTSLIFNLNFGTLSERVQMTANLGHSKLLRVTHLVILLSTRMPRKYSSHGDLSGGFVQPKIWRLSKLGNCAWLSHFLIELLSDPSAN